MENGQTQKKEQQAQVKQSLSPAFEKMKQIYCILCRRTYPKKDAQEHWHSLFHHTQLQTVMGDGALHECQACNISAKGLVEYAKHITNTQHKVKLQILISKNVKPVSLEKSLSPEILNKILSRNKQLKPKKKSMKKRKKLKEQSVENEQQNTPEKKPVQRSKDSTPDKSKQEPAKVQETQNVGAKPDVKNDNQAASQPRSLQHTPCRQGPSRRFVDWKGWPAGQFAGHPPGYPVGYPWHQPHFPHHFTPPPPPPPPPPRYYRFAVMQSNAEASVPQGAVPRTPERATEFPVSRDSATFHYSPHPYFTSDLLPPKGVYIFESPKSSKRTHKHSAPSGQSAPKKKPPNAEPQSNADVDVMLKQIRRVASGQEPCGAHQEVRKNNSEGGLSAAKGHVAQTAGSGTKQPADASSESRKTSAPKTSSNQQASAQAGSEQTTDASRKVRIAHKPGKAHMEATLKRKPNWTELYHEAKNKGKVKQGSTTQTKNQTAEIQSSPQSDVSDPPLSEGFHWGSHPGSPLNSQLDLQFPLQAATDAADRPEAVTGLTTKVESNSRNNNEEHRDDNQATKRKHNSVTEDSDCEVMSIEKKKKTSDEANLRAPPDQSQMDQLLIVSLREEELNNSLHEMDESLIHARTALQAAYAEVQRIMLLKQQCVVEINSLRAKRIEILQDMQADCPADDLTADPKAAGTASTSSAGVPAPVQPPSLPPSTTTVASLSQASPAKSLPSAVPKTRPSPLALSTKKEMCHLPVAGQSLHSAEAQQLPSVPLTASREASHEAQQPTAEGPTSTNTLPPGSSAVQKWEELQDCVEVLAEGQDEKGKKENLDSGQAEGKTKIKNCTDDKGNESDASVEIIHSSTSEIIAIEESDCEESKEAKEAKAPVEPGQPEEPKNKVYSSASAQTAQQVPLDCKKPLIAVIKDVSNSAESVEEQQPAVGAFSGHTGPIHGLQIHEGLLYTCSGDNTARAYCLLTRECKAVFEGHTSKINCLLVSAPHNLPARLFTGASDQTIRSFSIKTNKCVDELTLPNRVLCLHEAWNILYAGLASGSVISFDLKTLKQLDVMECHGPRGVSCLGTAQEGARRLLLVGSYDSTISVRDAKSGLLLRSLEGHSKTVLCLKVVNDLVFSGSSDTSVHAHNIHTGELLRIYKGHGHAVTSIVILGKVMVTSCLDKLVRVYELQSHDRLQVYGGHSDMVMCMAVHKSVIYTGCLDGSVQAVKLNLMKNYRCLWQSCAMIFGVPEHLLQHLTSDHTNPGLQTAKCRWKGCDTFFPKQQSIKQKLPEHMQKHIEKDSSEQS